MKFYRFSIKNENDDSEKGIHEKTERFQANGIHLFASNFSFWRTRGLKVDYCRGQS